MILAFLDGNSPQECFCISEDFNYVKFQMSSLNIKYCKERPGVVGTGFGEGGQPGPRRKKMSVVCSEAMRSPCGLNNES